MAAANTPIFDALEKMDKFDAELQDGAAEALSNSKKAHADKAGVGGAYDIQAVKNDMISFWEGKAEAKRQKEDTERERMAQSDVQALKDIKAKFPMFPAWEGGNDYQVYIEDNHISFSAATDIDLIPAYCQRLRAAGFKLQTAKSKFDDNLYDFYKVIDGVYYGFMPDMDGGFVDGRNHMMFYILDNDGIRYVKEYGEK